MLIGTQGGRTTFSHLRVPIGNRDDAPVAQLDRASDFESAGRAFESHRACQISQGNFEYIFEAARLKIGMRIRGFGGNNLISPKGSLERRTRDGERPGGQRDKCPVDICRTPEG